jgi:hypothetical protein
MGRFTGGMGSNNVDTFHQHYETVSHCANFLAKGKGLFTN